ncbi:uncharacterized protein [Pyrus communis]|uniref:uncharacterized protein n=1 Tax=Pyrus communis TaxID=23211 RepID=UPI0035BF0CFE
MERLLAHWYAITKQPHSGINLVEFLAEADDGPVLTFDKVQAAPAELEDHRPQVKDPLEEVNVGTADDPRTLFISALLPPAMKVELRELLHEFKDYFAWSYHEMPGLDRNLVEHELRIKEGCKPFRQPPRRFSNEVQLGIKEELVRLLKAGFIRTARCTNNQAEYEALIIGLHVLHDLRASRVLVLGDSELVINQLNGIFRCMSCTLAPYHMVATYLAESFERITFEHISRTHNTDDDELAQIASGAQLMGGKLGRIAATGLQSYPALIDRQNFQRTHVIRTRVMSLPSLLERGDPVEVCAVEVEPDDWRKTMLRYLDNPNGKHDRRTKVLATNYVSYQNELYRKGEDGLLLLCLDPHEADQAMAERAPAELLHSVTKPWPFRGWAMDVIGKITPSSGAAKHAWIMVATDYFTKWVEARSYAELTAKEVCDFVEENIVTRFGVPETIITDNGTIFTADRFREYAASLNIRLEQSTPYYPQANGQAEASNKVLIGILEKMVKEKPGLWHLRLNEALWAYRTSPRSATGTTPYALTYGHDAMLPVELSISSLRVIEQSDLFSIEYCQAMRQELEDLEESRIDAGNLLVAQKKIAERVYNQRE